MQQVPGKQIQESKREYNKSQESNYRKAEDSTTSPQEVPKKLKTVVCELVLRLPPLCVARSQQNRSRL